MKDKENQEDTFQDSDASQATAIAHKVESVKVEPIDKSFESGIAQVKDVKASILSARYGYTALGIAMAVWASLVPYAKARLDISESELGLLLLFLGFGAIIAMPISGALTSRFGCKRMQDICMPIYYISLLMLAFVPNSFGLAAALFVFGGMSGMLDVVMNLQVVFLEQISGRRLMSTLHAMYSVGTAIGAGLIALLLVLKLTPLLAVLVIATFIFLCHFGLFSKHFYPSGGEKGKIALIVIPKGPVLLLGAICYVLYMIEGVAMDWGALFMHNMRGVATAEAGLAYGLFAVTMTFGRFFGDRIGEIIGSKKFLIYSCAFTCFAFIMLFVLDSTFGAYFSFFLVGLGASNTITQLLTITSKAKHTDIPTAISGVSTLGYLGLLSGPALMGFVAEYAGLPYIFTTMAVLMGIVTLVCFRIQDVK